MSSEERNEDIAPLNSNSEAKLQNTNQESIGQEATSPAAREFPPKRPSFAPPFPAASASQLVSNALAGGTPLTNHEIYELIQKSQQLLAAQQQQQQLQPSGSLKSPKRLSLYTRSPSKARIERQGSIIVGTPGFRERYGKSRIANKHIFLFR